MTRSNMILFHGNGITPELIIIVDCVVILIKAFCYVLFNVAAIFDRTIGKLNKK